MQDDRVIEEAVAMFRRDGWLDLRALARAADVGRATLYRRYGDRDALLGEVVWRAIGPALGEIRQANRGRGVDSVVATIRQALHAAAAAPPLRALMRDHPETGFRVLTSSDGIVQRRLLAAVEDLIREEVGEPDELSVETLAYAVVRLAESFYHRELITGDAPDIDAAAVIIRRLLSRPS